MTALRRRTGNTWRALSGAIAVAVAPGKPRFIGAVAPSSSAADVAWQPPATGGSAITGYRVTVSPGGATHDYAAGATSATITGLTNGTAYTFTIHATNAVGPGAESAPTAPVTPSASALVRRTTANTGPLGVFDAELGRKLTYDDLTAYVGPSRIATPGVTFYRKVFTASPEIFAHDVTFDQCLIKPPASALYSLSWAAMAGGVKPTGLTLIDTEVDGNGIDWDGVTTDGTANGDAPSACIEPGIGYTAQRCRFHSATDILKPQDNPVGSGILIEDCLLDHPVFPRGAHADILQIAGTGAHDVTIRRCTFDGHRPDIGQHASSSLIQWGSFPKATDGSPVAVLENILIEDCFVEGGTYASRISTASAAVCQNVIIRRPRIGLHHLFGAFTFNATGFATDGGRPEVQDATWSTAGTTDYGQAVLAGQVIP